MKLLVVICVSCVSNKLECTRISLVVIHSMSIILFHWSLYELQSYQMLVSIHTTDMASTIYANVIRENINFLKIIRTRLFKRITVLIVRMKILLSSLCINFKFRIM